MGGNRIFIAILALSLFTAHVAAVGARAADDQPAKGTEVKAGDHGAGKEADHGGASKNPFKPSYNPLDLTLWSIVVFLLMLGILWKFAWKPILTGLQQREATIAEAVELAERTRREAMEQAEKLQAQMRASAGEVAAMIDAGRRDAQAVKEKLLADAKAEIQHERDRLLREVESSKDQALQEIWKLSVGLAASMSAKAIGRAVTDDDHRRFLDESLAELKQAGTGFGTRKLSGAGGL